VGVRKQDLFVISDLYEEKCPLLTCSRSSFARLITDLLTLSALRRYLTGVILNLYALAPIIQRHSSYTGPLLVRYA
jgi:hypothetical protein